MERNGDIRERYGDAAEEGVIKRNKKMSLLEKEKDDEREEFETEGASVKKMGNYNINCAAENICKNCESKGASVKKYENSNTYATESMCERCERKESDVNKYVAFKENCTCELKGASVNGVDVNSIAYLEKLRNCRDFTKMGSTDINVCNGEQQTLLSIAAQHGDSKCLDSLIRAGALIDKKDIYGCTPLFYAALKGNASCVFSLVRAGADVNMADTQGNTVLMAAANSGCEQSVKFVLKAGACVNRTNHVGRNALVQYLVNGNDRKVASLLYAAGETIDGDTIQLAEMNGEIITMEIPEYIRNKKLDLCLQHSCRQTVRKRLMEVDGKTNLFLKVPQLPLPTLLSRHLMYNCEI